MAFNGLWQEESWLLFLSGRRKGRQAAMDLVVGRESAPWLMSSVFSPQHDTWFTTESGWWVCGSVWFLTGEWKGRKLQRMRARFLEEPRGSAGLLWGCRWGDPRPAEGQTLLFGTAKTKQVWKLLRGSSLPGRERGWRRDGICKRKNSDSLKNPKN